MPEQTLDRYPVIVETREKYVIWVEAESQEDAVKTLSDDSEIYELLIPEHRAPEGYDYSVDPVDDWNWASDVYHYSRKLGPQRGCNECRASGLDLYTYVPHAENCSRKAVDSDGR
ncbi:hypothetical protein [Streptomyces sp. NPDC001194]|uniref:hypothetical protein n=1 Tax=Streptomyces sp. NPDC001194 TaxID=3364547 RepID=UPI00367C0127